MNTNDDEDDAEEYYGDVNPMDIEVDVDDTVNYNNYIQSYKADPVARGLAKQFCIKAANIMIKYNHFKDPEGEYTADMIEKDNTMSGHYVIMCDQLKKVEKVGMTRNLRNRKRMYVDGGLDGRRFRRIVEFDATEQKVNDDMEKLYRQFLSVMKSDEKLHPFQQTWFRMIDEREGERIGIKSQIWLQMIECGFQIKYGVPCVMEFLMFDRVVCDRLYDDAAKYARMILQCLPKLKEQSTSSNDDDDDDDGDNDDDDANSSCIVRPNMHLFGIASWKPGFNGISTQIETTKSVVGKYKWGDTIDYHRHPTKPKTAEQMYTRCIQQNTTPTRIKQVDVRNFVSGLVNYFHQHMVSPFQIQTV